MAGLGPLEARDPLLDPLEAEKDLSAGHVGVHGLGLIGAQRGAAGYRGESGTTAGAGAGLGATMKSAPSTADLSTSVGPVPLHNPILLASGTFGGVRNTVIDVNRLGGIVAKTVTMEPRKGNPTPSGMLNSIGLDNKGLEGWIARAALSLVNTLKGIAIDWRKRKPCLGAGTGGLSGPAIKPIALRMVWEVCSRFPKAPVVGIGGIATADDVLAFMVAGAK